MHTQVVGAEGIDQAVKWLRRGEAVAFPTETVYGLGADGLNDAACRKIFQAKGRPADNPLILHVLDKEGLAALSSQALPDTVSQLVEAFWPGPLTVVVRAADFVPEAVRAGLDTVAVRAPNHPMARRLIAELGRPIAAPSANRSGRPSPTRAEDVVQDLGGLIPLVIDGGPTEVGLESTVVDCTVYPPVLLRPGSVTEGEIVSVIGALGSPDAQSPVRSPGMKYRHYAPQAPVIWIQSRDFEVIERAVRDIQNEYQNPLYMAPERLIGKLPGTVYNLGMTDKDVGNRLYRGLRDLDRQSPSAIVVIWQSHDGMARAIANRLEKASTRQVVS